MGRVARYKKIKAVDPFSRTKGHVDLLKGKDYDLPPTARDMKVDGYRPKLLPKVKPHAEKRGATEKQKPEKLFGHLKAVPGESLKAFNRRVNNELKKRLVEVKAANPITHLNTVSDARKEYLEAKAEKKKRKKAGLPADAPATADTADEPAPVSGVKRRREVPEDFPTEKIAFGDRVEAPPTLTAQPRKSKTQRNAEALAAVRRLNAKHKAEDEARDSSADEREDDTSKAAAEAERKVALRKAQMEKLRTEAMAAYAAVKKKRLTKGDHK